MYRRFKLSSALVIAVLATMIVVPLAYGVFRSINTNDGLLDPDWATTTPSPYITDGTGDTVAPGAGRTDLDVTQGFVATDGATGSDFLYFRLDTAAGPSAPAVGENLFVSIDCNDNGNFLDDNGAPGPTDVSVVYQRATDSVAYIVTATSTGLGSGVATDGEQPPGANNSNEWQVQKSTLLGFGCTNVVSGNLRFAFGTAIGPDEIDSTAIGSAISWNSPTTVRLQQFGAAVDNTFAWLLFGVVLVAGLGTGLYWRQRRRGA